MGLRNLLRRLFEPFLHGRGFGVAELARRLGMDEAELRAIEPAYREFTIKKRSGGERRISAPDAKLKQVQRLLLKRVLARLRAHPAAMGFERGRSIVTNAREHTGRAVVVCMDLKDFFPSTTADRVLAYFRKIGWNREATALLVRLCTQGGGLPQGAPTSPRLSNLVNYRLDARLTGAAKVFGAVYTRYADDIAFSFAVDDPSKVRLLISGVKQIVGEFGYKLHHRKKLHIRRRHQCQMVTGLVVNVGVNLPRRTRRWLRAVEHRARRTHKPDDGLVAGQIKSEGPSLTEGQRAGWRSLEKMIAGQSNAQRGD